MAVLRNDDVEQDFAPVVLCRVFYGSLSTITRLEDELYSPIRVQTRVGLQSGTAAGLHCVQATAVCMQCSRQSPPKWTALQ